ncbi:hypothetical protein ZWY2020_040917 [Hordeum vulgare]|nr:hypothetical protein ZWY2020_040917 [Hordeum vulgare]
MVRRSSLEKGVEASTGTAGVHPTTSPGPCAALPAPGHGSARAVVSLPALCCGRVRPWSHPSAQAVAGPAAHAIPSPRQAVAASARAAWQRHAVAASRPPRSWPPASPGCYPAALVAAYPRPPLGPMRTTTPSGEHVCGTARHAHPWRQQRMCSSPCSRRHTSIPASLAQPGQ